MPLNFLYLPVAPHCSFFGTKYSGETPTDPLNGSNECLNAGGMKNRDFRLDIALN